MSVLVATTTAVRRTSDCWCRSPWPVATADTTCAWQRQRRSAPPSSRPACRESRLIRPVRQRIDVAVAAVRVEVYTLEKCEVVLFINAHPGMR